MHVFLQGAGPRATRNRKRVGGDSLPSHTHPILLLLSPSLLLIPLFFLSPSRSFLPPFLFLLSAARQGGAACVRPHRQPQAEDEAVGGAGVFLSVFSRSLTRSLSFFLEKGEPGQETGEQEREEAQG